MRILMLGNSFTYCNDLDRVVASFTGAEVVRNVRGGAQLAEQLNPATELGARAKELLKEKWDYVVLQEMSIGPVKLKEGFMQSVKELSSLARKSGARPLLYATWAYEEGSEKLASAGMTYDEMSAALYASYHEAAEKYGCLIADVGRAFDAMRGIVSLYENDSYHPTRAGTTVAALVITHVIETDIKNNG